MMRCALSATPPSSRIVSTILRPATVSPFCCMNSAIAALSCLPTALNPAPVIGMLIPIFNTGCCAIAGRATTPPNAVAAMPLSTVRRRMIFLPIMMVLFDCPASGRLEMWNLRPFPLRLAGNRRPRQAGGAGFHDESVLDRIPRRHNVGRPGPRIFMPHEIADEVARHAELRIGFEVFVLGIVNLRDQRLETGLV